MVGILMVDKLLQGNDLAYMRSEAEKAMPDLVDIQRKTLTSDKQGGFTEAWANSYQQVAARIAGKGGGESNEAGRLDLQLDFMLTLAHDQSITQTDRVVHTSGTYEIQSVDTGKSWSATIRCQMRRL